MRLEADINFTDMQSPYPDKTIYFEIDKKYGYMLNDDSYDAFVLVPLWLAMLHKQDLYIRGKISKKLYQNIKWYIQKIWCDFYDALSPVTFLVDGFSQPPKKLGKIVGAGISCGVDSLCTLYDHFVKENDPDYKINALFYFDCGILAQIGMEDNLMRELAVTRSEPGQKVAQELGLPYHYLKTNLKSFRKDEDITKYNYIAIYSCALSLSNGMSRYYMPAERTYEQIKNFHAHSMGGFCESYLVPLVETEKIELIIDGCQYRRVDKIKILSEWEIAKKYLNVCWRYTPDGSNCCHCPKCFRTMLALEIMGKLENFSRVFDIDEYKKNSLGFKVSCMQNYGKDVYDTENVDFAKENNFPMPTKRECFVLGNQATII